MADADYRPRVSAIIVVRNGEEFLREAIDSVISQTFQDWELIIVDDGSTDRTANIVSDYVSSNPTQIRLIAHPDHGNHGISASRNLGLSHSSGDFIAFLDADDVWLPNKLNEQVSILEADETLGLVYGRTQIWNSWNKAEGGLDYYYPLGVPPEQRYNPPVLFELLLENKAQTPTTCNAMMRSYLFTRTSGFEIKFRGMFEDLTFFARALALSSAYVSGQTWARYRQHPASCTAVSAARGEDEVTRLVFLNWLARAIEPTHPSPQVRAAIRRARIAAAGAALKSVFKRILRRLR